MNPEEMSARDQEQLRYVNILDYLVIIAKYKKFVVRFTLVSVTVAIILLFFILSRLVVYQGFF